MTTERRDSTTYYNVYIASDGREFKDEAECKKYEATCQCAMNTLGLEMALQVFAADNFKDATACIDWDDRIFLFEPKSANDIDALNKWYVSHKYYRKGDCFLPSDMGTRVIAVEYSYDDSVCIMRKDELLKQFTDAIDRLYKTDEELREDAAAN